MGNGEIHLLVKGNFKRSIESDEFDKIRQNIVHILIQDKKLESTKLEIDRWNETYSLKQIYFIYILSQIMTRLRYFCCNLTTF